jgi:hypothetical protein
MGSTDLTLPQRAVGPRSGQLSQSGGWLGLLVERLPLLALGVLLLAAAFPAQAPTVREVLDGGGNTFWAGRIGPVNPFEILLVLVAGLTVLRSLVVRQQTSSFDRPLLGAALIIGALQLVALSHNSSTIEYLPLDTERMLLPLAGYLIVTRSLKDQRALSLFTYGLGAVVAARTIELVLQYGGATEFGTITGSTALLITEDTLLVLLPLALAWGALVDGRLALPSMLGTVLLVGVLLGIDLLSLRRGALILIGGALLVRSLGIGRRRLLQTGVALLIVFGLAVAAGPGRPLLHQIRYTAVSSLLKTKDASSGQRTAEISSFVDNMDPLDWVSGHGVGTSWNVYAKSPLDALSFGTGESEFTRIGWHVYGLDWTYKFGLAGLLALLGALIVICRRLWQARRWADPPLRTLMYSLAVCAPAFLLVMFTNPRVATFAGITVGLLSRCCDLAGQTRISPSGRRGSPDSSALTSAA